ncbi:amidase [Mycobacterium sp. NPDC003449]
MSPRPTTDMPTGVRSAARRIRDGRLTPVDLLELSIDRMRQVDPHLRAFVAFDEERAREDASTLTREAAAGRFLGPLHGVPVAVKDVIDVAGMPTRGGSRVTDPAPVTVDAPVVRRLRAAGALILGKTRTHEFAHGVTTPPSRNPWDPERIPGGSSGGSAVAVASGQCLAAIGSDTGGSIRVPAALCGVSGLRPARGDVPTGGVLEFSPRLDTCGPIARDALDLKLLFEVLSGRAGPESTTVDGMRIGTVGRAELGELTPGVEESVAGAVEELAATGANVRSVDVPPFRSWSAARAVYVLTDFLEVHRRAGFYPQRRADYSEEVASYLSQAERITPAARAAAVDDLERLARGLQTALADVDVLVLPTTPIGAPRVADCEFDPRAQGRASIIETLMRLCGPFSWCGLAAVTVPCGTDSAGLPVGLQIAGRDVSTVLTVAAAYQDRTAHHLARPGPLATV